MKYFVDTHDRTKGSFPQQELTEQHSSTISTRLKRLPIGSALSDTPRT
jgi:hypothetical protein